MVLRGFQPFWVSFILRSLVPYIMNLNCSHFVRTAQAFSELGILCSTVNLKDNDVNNTCTFTNECRVLINVVLS